MGVGGINPDVMAWKSRNQFAFRRDRPFIEMCHEPVSVGKDKFSSLQVVMFSGKLRGADKRGDDCGECRRRIAGVFLPSFLTGNRPLQDQIGRNPHHHYAGIEEIQRDSIFVEAPSQQERRGNFVELHARPISGSVNPAILREAAILMLNGCQPDQGAQRRVGLTRRQKRGRALHQIASPDQMVTAPVIVRLGFAPGNAHRGDHGALENLVFVSQQNASAQPIRTGRRRKCVR